MEKVIVLLKAYYTFQKAIFLQLIRRYDLFIFYKHKLITLQEPGIVLGDRIILYLERII